MSGWGRRLLRGRTRRNDDLLSDFVISFFEQSPVQTVDQILMINDEANDAIVATLSREDARELLPDREQERERMRVEVPRALDQLVARGLLARSEDSYTVTPEGIAYRDQRRAERVAALSPRAPK